MVEIELPYYWKTRAPRKPYGFDPKEEKSSIYIILFFERRRTLLLSRNYSVLGTMETRYAKKILEEAKENNWVAQNWENYDGGDRPEGYPKKCDTAHWIEIKSNKQ